MREKVLGPLLSDTVQRRSHPMSPGDQCRSHVRGKGGKGFHNYNMHQARDGERIAAFTMLGGGAAGVVVGIV